MTSNKVRKDDIQNAISDIKDTLSNVTNINMDVLDLTPEMEDLDISTISKPSLIDQNLLQTITKLEIEKWLEKNLPGIVKEIVEKQLQKMLPNDKE